MGFGTRVGSYPSFIGSAIGSAADDEGNTGGGGIVGVTRDASSAKYVPATATEFNTLLAALSLSGLGTPSSIYNFQEAATPVADVIGTDNLGAGGTPLFAQAVPGWTRKGVGFNGGVGQRFSRASGSPNPTTTSQLWVFFMSVDVLPGVATRFAFLADSASAYRINVNTAGVIQAIVAGVTTSGATNMVGQGIVPVAFLYDRANSRANVYNLSDKVVGTYSAGILDGAKGIGATAASVTGSCVYGFKYQGAPAEAITDANLKSLLTGMGFPIGWT